MAIIRDNSDNENGIDEKERANRNNANNIRNAADVAIATNHPYGVMAGTAIKGLDKATNGKSTDAFGRLATRAGNAVPGGKKAQDLSNKLSESGVSDAVGNAAALKNSAGGSPGGAPGSLDAIKKNNLKNDKDKQNFLQRRREAKRKHEEDKKRRKANSLANDDNKDDENKDSSDNSTAEDLKGKGKVSFKVKMILLGVVLLILGLMSLALIMGIFGINISTQLPSLGPSTYGTDQFDSVYEKDTKEYKEEVEYYKKLNKVSEDYKEKNGEDLKTSYIHAVLIYKTYFVDPEEQPDENKYIMQIDFKELTNNVDKIVELMKPSEDGESIDYSKNGEFYNNLKNSDDFKKYYKDLLKERKIDDLLNEIFDLAEDLDEVEVPDETVLTSEVTVDYTKPTPTAKPTSSTPLPTTTIVTKMSINDYLADSIYASTNVTNSEVVKAYTITYSTNIISENKKLTITSQSAKASNPLCSVKQGCSYDSSGNLTDGGSTQSSKNTTYYNGKYYYKLPLSTDEQKELNKNINSVYGDVIVNTDGTYPTLDPNKLYGLGDGDYKKIINSAYGSDIQYKNVGEDSYAHGINYGNKKVLTPVIFYDQKDYSGQYCRLKGMTIAGSGCALTAMAIITSTYKDSKEYNPLYMNEEARKIGGVCSYTGTSPSFFCKEAVRRGFKCTGGGKGQKFLQNVIDHLKNGDLVVAHMHYGKFTSKGHYIVLGGVDPETKKVYVYDPNNRSNKGYRKSGNGWYSFNDVIVKEAWNFYIVWQRG